MLGVLFAVVSVWIYALAITIMVLRGDFPGEYKESVFVGFIGATVITFLTIGSNW